MQTKYYNSLKIYNMSIQSIKIFLKSQKQLPLHFSPIKVIYNNYSEIIKLNVIFLVLKIQLNNLMWKKFKNDKMLDNLHTDLKLITS